MINFYGHKWSSVRGTDPAESDPKGIWIAVLAGVTQEQYNMAMRSILDGGDYTDWPPTGPQFKALCHPKTTGQGLPRPKTDPKVMEDGFAALNKILKGG
jgi:hypothetical protein